MSKEKVFIEGHVVGSFADTLGTKGKQIQIASGDTVDIDDNFIYKSIELEKVKVPQFVADYIEESRLKGWDLLASMCFVVSAKNKKTTKWFYLGENKNIFALAWIFGYDVEEEKRYLVKVVGMDSVNGYLSYNKDLDRWFFGIASKSKPYRSHHTRKELEDAGFGWVFDCPGIEIEEVTE